MTDQRCFFFIYLSVYAICCRELVMTNFYGVILNSWDIYDFTIFDNISIKNVVFFVIIDSLKRVIHKNRIKFHKSKPSMCVSESRETVRNVFNVK